MVEQDLFTLRREDTPEDVYDPHCPAVDFFSVLLL
jgi:hypothetical protein